MSSNSFHKLIKTMSTRPNLALASHQPPSQLVFQKLCVHIRGKDTSYIEFEIEKLQSIAKVYVSKTNSQTHKVKAKPARVL